MILYLYQWIIMNTFNRILLLLILLFTWSGSMCQIVRHYDEYDLIWGEPYRDLGNVERILKTTEDDYISVTSRTNLFNFFTNYKRRFYFEPIRDLRNQRQKKIKLFGDGERTYLEDFAVLEEQLLIISRKKRFLDNEVNLYYHFLDPDKTIHENHGFHLETYAVNRSLSYDFLTVTNNLSKSKVGYLYTLPGSRNDFPTYSFGVFDSTFHISTQGTSIFPYRYKEMQFTESFITPQGDFYVLAEELINDNDFLWRGNAGFRKQLTVFKLKNGELTNFNVEHDQLLLKEIEIIAEGDDLIFSGLYADDVRSGIRGVFFIRMDSIGNVKQEEYTRFSTDFIVHGQQLPRNLAPDDMLFREGLGQYKMKELRRTEDGGFIGIAEHHDEEERFSGTGAPGTSNRVDTYFYYNNIMVYKMDSTGRLLWNTYVPKNQHSINDGGYYLSYAHYFNDNKLYFVFNDNSKNYDDNNEYISASDPKTAHFNSWRNTIAVVSMNIEDGKYVRKSIGGKKLTDIVVVPRLCIENLEENELFLYGKSGNKHRFGRLQFSVE